MESELKKLRVELDELQSEESTIDFWIQHLQDKLHNDFLNNPEINKYTFLTQEDFKELSRQ